ncbi:MAG: cell division protein CrgA [Actinomycetota bacterium]
MAGSSKSKGGSRKGRSASGRTTARNRQGTVGRYVDAEHSGRYTAPTPEATRHSPSWWGPVLLGLMILGVLIILLNYLTVLPGSASAWYLLVGLGVVFAGFGMATRYH